MFSVSEMYALAIQAAGAIPVIMASATMAEDVVNEPRTDEADA